MSGTQQSHSLVVVTIVDNTSFLMSLAAKAVKHYKSQRKSSLQGDITRSAKRQLA